MVVNTLAKKDCVEFRNRYSAPGMGRFLTRIRLLEDGRWQAVAYRVGKDELLPFAVATGPPELVTELLADLPPPDRRRRNRPLTKVARNNLRFLAPKDPSTGDAVLALQERDDRR